VIPPPPQCFCWPYQPIRRINKRHLQLPNVVFNYCSWQAKESSNEDAETSRREASESVTTAYRWQDVTLALHFPGSVSKTVQKKDAEGCWIGGSKEGVMNTSDMGKTCRGTAVRWICRSS